MRPDEHKKRKNAQYKKKHGIASKDKETNSKQRDEGGNKEKDAVKKSHQVGEQNTENRTTPSQYCDHLEKTQASVPLAAENDDKVDKQFRRKPIVNNWSRYDSTPSDTDEDDAPLQRGEDFNKLLTQTGDASTQFKMKDEQDWCENIEQSTVSLLTVDFENLSMSLSCIPLHERLDIGEELLSVEQINELTATALSNKDNYVATVMLIAEVKRAGSHVTETTDMPAIITDQTKDVSIDKSEIVIRKSDATNDNFQHAPAKFKEVLSLEEDLDILLSATGPLKDPTMFAHSKYELDYKKGNRDSIKEGVEQTTALSTKNNTSTRADLDDLLDSLLDD